MQEKVLEGTMAKVSPKLVKDGKSQVPELRRALSRTRVCAPVTGNQPGRQSCRIPRPQTEGN